MLESKLFSVFFLSLDVIFYIMLWIILYKKTNLYPGKIAGITGAAFVLPISIIFILTLISGNELNSADYVFITFLSLLPLALYLLGPLWWRSISPSVDELIKVMAEKREARKK